MQESRWYRAFFDVFFLSDKTIQIMLDNKPTIVTFKTLGEFLDSNNPSDEVLQTTLVNTYLTKGIKGLQDIEFSIEIKLDNQQSLIN